MTNRKATSLVSKLYDTPPAYHGALDYAELEALGLDPATILDFSVNSNPYGPSPAVSEAILHVPLDRYPDREALALRRALAVRLQVSPDHIVAGNGAAELLWLVALTFIGPRDRVLIIGPTFGEYSRLAQMMGAEVVKWTAKADRNFAVSAAEVTNSLRRYRPTVMFLCNPNNPTGLALPVETISVWAAAHPDTLFVVDEAYLAFAPEAQSTLTLKAGNILAVHSMTKNYALAGLRLGYAVSHSLPLMVSLAKARPAWNVNALAQAAGVAALADETHQRQSLQGLGPAKRTLVSGLVSLGLAPLPSATHFFLMSVENAALFRQSLLEGGILVRDCASFGLPDYVRISTRRPAENERLLAAIQIVGIPGRAGARPFGEA